MLYIIYSIEERDGICESIETEIRKSLVQKGGGAKKEPPAKPEPQSNSSVEDEVNLKAIMSKLVEIHNEAKDDRAVNIKTAKAVESVTKSIDDGSKAKSILQQNTTQYNTTMQFQAKWYVMTEHCVVYCDTVQYNVICMIP